jgi:hypothetical protein
VLAQNPHPAAAPPGGKLERPGWAGEAAPDRSPVAPSQHRLAFVALAAYVAIQIVLVWHHEPWRDEADTWLVARDTDLAGLFGLTAYAGTPAMWYVVLKLLVATGLPYFSQQLLNLAIATAAVGLFLFRAPFPLWFRLLFAFSYFPAYEYSVVARSYATGMLLIFAAAALHGQRRARPIAHALVVAALANVNVHGLVLATVIGGLQLWEARRNWSRAAAPLGLMLAGGLAAVWQLWPPADGQFPAFFHGTNWAALPHVVARPLVPVDGGLGAPKAYFAAALLIVLAATWWSRREPWRVRSGGLAALAAAFALPGPGWPSVDGVSLPAVAFGLLALVSLTVTLSDRPLALAALVAGLGGLAYVFIFTYGVSERHLGHVLLWWLYCLWIADGLPRRSTGSVTGWRHWGAIRAASAATACLALTLGLAVSCALAVQQWRVEIRDAFSGATEMAAFLDAHGLAERPIIAHLAPHASAVLAHLPPRAFYYAGEERFGSHMLWNAAYRRALARPSDDAVAAALVRFSDRADVLVLLSAPLRSPERHGLRLLHATEGRIFGEGNERFHLYEVVPRRQRS